MTCRLWTIALVPALALYNSRVTAQTGLSRPEPPPAFFALPADAPAPRGSWLRGDSTTVALDLTPQERSRIYAAVLIHATPPRYGPPVLTYGLLTHRNQSAGVATDVAAGDSLILAQARSNCGVQGPVPTIDDRAIRPVRFASSDGSPRDDRFADLRDHQEGSAGIHRVQWPTWSVVRGCLSSRAPLWPMGGHRRAPHRELLTERAHRSSYGGNANLPDSSLTGVWPGSWSAWPSNR